MPKRVGVLLSGCGAFDGSDTHGAVLTLLALDIAGAEAICTAPNKAQRHVLNHMNQEETEEVRNVLVESARLARGNIVDLAALSAQDLDAMILPDGFGAVKTLSDFAFKGPAACVDPLVKRILETLQAAGKPIGAAGIASATVVNALTDTEPEVTIGTDTGTAAALETMGAHHHACRVNQVHVDRIHKIVTTPAYMLGTRIQEVAQGIELMVEHVLNLIESQA